MFGSNILEVAVGILFVYSLLSLICSTVNEWIIARLLALRSMTLEAGISNLIGIELTRKLYAHQLINGLARPGKFDSLLNRDSKPSYIPSRTFALALLDIVSQPTIVPQADPKVLAALATLKRAANGNPAQEQLNVAQWFDDTMERVSGWYKRKVQLMLFALALVICACLNIDTFGLISGLSRDATVRSAIVSSAQGAAANQRPPLLDVRQAERSLQQLQPELGWSPDSLPVDLPGWFSKICGLLTTTIAVSLGAPFWFDLLSRVVSLRSVGGIP
ncbi:MAG: hypothetical protein M3Z08_20395 [Chloroflexota bacterium]|nr:hypothetical protein [Chloroflexota bacterium]